MNCELCQAACTRNRHVRFKAEKGCVVLCLTCHRKLFQSYALQRKLPKLFGPGGKP